VNGERIYAVGYRPLDYRGPRQPPAWAIARTLLLLAWRKRSTKLALLFCLGVVLLHGGAVVVQLLVRRMADQAAHGLGDVQVLVGQTQEVFASFLTSQFFFTAIALGVIAGGAVAEDRSAGAFDLYFARPLTPRQYAAGKLLGAGLVPGVTLVAPALLLWLVAAGISPPDLRADLWWLAVPLLAGALLAAATLTATIVGVSALGQKARTVGVTYVGLLLVLTAMGEAMAAGGLESMGYLAPERDLRTVADALLQVGMPSLAGQLFGRHATNPSAALSALGLAAYVAVGLGALAWRLRAEVAET
jgi:ABC-type transport system involved in multi-copper enzyme maturation permease subunit